MTEHLLSSPLGKLSIMVVKPGHFRVSSASNKRRSYQGLLIKAINFDCLSAWVEFNKSGTCSVYSLTLYYDEENDRNSLQLTPRQRKSVRDTLVDVLTAWWTTDQEQIAREDIEAELSLQREQILLTLNTLGLNLREYRDGLKRKADLPAPPKDDAKALKSLLHQKPLGI